MATSWWCSAEASAQDLPGAQVHLREDEVGASTGVAEKAMMGSVLLNISARGGDARESAMHSAWPDKEEWLVLLTE